MKKLKRYIEKMLLDITIENNILFIGDKGYKILDSDKIYFDNDFEWLPKLKHNEKLHGWVYFFMGRWYIHEDDGSDVSLNELKNIGKAVSKIPTENFIGIHSGYEILNGVGVYEDWIKKAKFLGVKNLGIVEKHTLSGVMDFQSQCKKADIKPIFGMTISIINEDGNDFLIKCYAKDFVGWQSLLKFNKIIQVNEQVHIEQDFFENNRKGLITIMDPKTMSFEDIIPKTSLYQLDTVIFSSEDKDIEYINNLEKFIKSDLEPVLLTDAYYIEKDDWHSREVLWGIAKAYDDKSKNQYFKSHGQYAKELIKMFSPSDKSWVSLFGRAKDNLQEIVDNCNFEYDTTSRHLPKYKMTKEESEKFSTNEELFLFRIKEGLAKVKLEDKQKYIDRLKIEIDVLKKGDVIDYFLILYDIIQFAKREDILTGVARGSAGGSLVSYLLGITYINPIDFNLLFERFLNEGRIGAIVECDAYEIELDDDSKHILNEKSLVRVIRNNEELPIFIEDLEEGDEVIKIF